MTRNVTKMVLCAALAVTCLQVSNAASTNNLRGLSELNQERLLVEKKRNILHKVLLDVVEPAPNSSSSSSGQTSSWSPPSENSNKDAPAPAAPAAATSAEDKKDPEVASSKRNVFDKVMLDLPASVGIPPQEFN